MRQNIEHIELAIGRIELEDRIIALEEKKSGVTNDAQVGRVERSNAAEH